MAALDSIVTGTLISYYHLCRRKLWLHHYHIRMEDESADVRMGKLIHETSYQKRNNRFVELAIGNIKIDFYDPREGLIYETKKSNRFRHIHIAQTKYYLFVLKRSGLNADKAIIEYPTIRKREEVLLDEEDHLLIPIWEKECIEIVEGPCPPLVRKTACKTCAYHDFCYAE